MFDCIEWDGWKWASGYGRVGWHGYAHREAWMAVHGPIPFGMCVCHRCDNPSCVNVTHLFLGTHDDNMKDRQAKGRTPKGHHHGQAKLTEEKAVFAMARLLSGETQTSVARSFGVSRSSILQLWRGGAWGWLFSP